MDSLCLTAALLSGRCINAPYAASVWLTREGGERGPPSVDGG